MSVDELIKRSQSRRQLPPPEMRRWIRKQARLSQAEIAGALKIDRATVSRWETGQRLPRGTLAEAYANLLNRLSGMEQ